jgi:predicted DNA-binding transcriptional regulator AlpA
MRKEKILLADLVTFSEAVALAGVSAPTLRKRMEAGTGPKFRKMGREYIFIAADVLAWKKEEYPDGKPRKGKKGHRATIAAALRDEEMQRGDCLPSPCRATLRPSRAAREQVAQATP